MQICIDNAARLNVKDKRAACVICGMAMWVEVGVKDNAPPHEIRFWCPANPADSESFQYPHDSESDDGRSVGVLQQQKSASGALWWGPTSQEMDPRQATAEFIRRLDKLSGGYHARDAVSAGQFAQTIQGSAFPDRYQAAFDDITALYEKVAATGAVEVPQQTNPALVPEPGFSGDPWWLADVLKAEGLNVIEVDGWKNRGQGDQGTLWGMVFHHTGSANETPQGIAFHPALGLAAHILIRPNGEVYVCGIGKANHAGRGSWWGIDTDNANEVTIGVEVAILPQDGAPHRTGYPDVQYNATVKTFAAVLRKLAQKSNRAISHKEWAQLGPLGWRQGKWDPGSIDMDIFRSDVQRQIDSHSPLGEDDVPLVNQPSGSIYRDSNDNLPWAGTPMDFIMDAQINEGRIEQLAKDGDPKCIELVRRTAEGRSPVDKSLTDQNRAQANSVLSLIEAKA